MKKAFEEGWGGVICKTLSTDASKARPACASLQPAACLAGARHLRNAGLHGLVWDAGARAPQPQPLLSCPDPPPPQTPPRRVCR